MLTVKHLSYSIHDKSILKDISLQIEEHTMTAIIGPNGCGKSTLLNHITGLHYSENTVFYKGQAIETIPRKQFAREIAVMIQQHNPTGDTMLAKDIVLMGRYPYKKQFMDYTEHDLTIAHEMMEKYGAVQYENTPLYQLSGGERQRVLIAKAFTQEPNLLLLDEPTNHLDIHHKINLMEELKKFTGTSIIILHDLNLAAQYCDNIIMMKHGEVVAHGSATEVMTPALLEEVFQVPFYEAFHDDGRHLYY